MQVHLRDVVHQVGHGPAGATRPPLVIEVASRLGDAIRNGTPPPMIPPPWNDAPATLALRDALAGAARVLSDGGAPQRSEAVRALLAVFGTGQRLTVNG